MTKYIRQIAPCLLLRLGASGAYSCLVAAIPFIVKLLLDGDFLHTKGILTLAACYLTVVLLSSLCQYISQRASWRGGRNLYLALRRDVFAGMLENDYYSFIQKDTAYYSSLLNNDISEVQRGVESSLMIVESSLHILAYGGFLAFLDYRLLLIIIFASCIGIFLPNVTAKELSSRKKRRLDSLAAYIERAQDILRAFTNINPLSKPFILKYYDKKLVECEDSLEHYGKFRAFSVVLNGTSMFLVGIITFFTVGILLVKNEISIGTAAAALTYTDQFIFPVKDILNSLSEIMSVRGVWGKISQFLPKNAGALTEATSRLTSLSVENLTAKRGDFTLENLSFSFELGKKYAIIGGNGSGKSTFLKALCGRLPLERGSIIINGEAQEPLHTSQYFEIIEQNQHIYQGSAMDNITLFGCYEVQDKLDSFKEHDKICEILEKQQAHLLSGGEKQILLILKAVVSQKPVFIMDEPLSAVDNQLSEFITKKLNSLEGKTIITITHNLSTEHLSLYDSLIELSRGKIV